MSAWNLSTKAGSARSNRSFVLAVKTTFFQSSNVHSLRSVPQRNRASSWCLNKNNEFLFLSVPTSWFSARVQRWPSLLSGSRRTCCARGCSKCPVDLECYSLRYRYPFSYECRSALCVSWCCQPYFGGSRTTPQFSKQTHPLSWNVLKSAFCAGVFWGFTEVHRNGWIKWG